MGGDNKEELESFIQEHSDLTGDDLKQFYSKFVDQEKYGEPVERPQCPLNKSGDEEEGEEEDGESKSGAGRKMPRRKFSKTKKQNKTKKSKNHKETKANRKSKRSKKGRKYRHKK